LSSAEYDAVSLLTYENAKDAPTIADVTTDGKMPPGAASAHGKFTNDQKLSAAGAPDSMLVRAMPRATTKIAMLLKVDEQERMADRTPDLILSTNAFDLRRGRRLSIRDSPHIS
jgi:hypothetical protein